MSNKNDRWSALSMKERAALISTYVSGGVMDLAEMKRHYNSFEPGGPIDTSKWKALGKVDIKAIPDSTFTREKTGLGDVEYFAAEHPKGITYPNGYHKEHPYKGYDVILYNPATNDEQDVRLDALHAMPKDLTYAVLNDVYRYHAQEGDVMHNAQQRYNEDVAKYGVENIDPLSQYFNNEADGLLRNMFIEGTPEYIQSKRYYPNKEELKQWNAHLMPYINEIQTYLETGEKPEYILEPAVVTAESKKSSGGRILDGTETEQTISGEPVNLGELEPAIVKPEPLYGQLNTFYPLISPFPFTGHSELQLVDFGHKKPITITKYGTDYDYNLVTNNCSDATRCAVEQIFGEKINPILFTTPGDVQDFVVKKIDEKPFKSAKGVTTLGFEVPFATAMDLKNQNIDFYIQDYLHKASEFKKKQQKEYPKWNSSGFDESVKKVIEGYENLKYKFQPFVDGYEIDESGNYIKKNGGNINKFDMGGDTEYGGKLSSLLEYIAELGTFVPATPMGVYLNTINRSGETPEPKIVEDSAVETPTYEHKDWMDSYSREDFDKYVNSPERKVKWALQNFKGWSKEDLDYLYSKLGDTGWDPKALAYAISGETNFRPYVENRVSSAIGLAQLTKAQMETLFGKNNWESVYNSYITRNRSVRSIIDDTIKQYKWMYDRIKTEPDNMGYGRLKVNLLAPNSELDSKVSDVIFKNSLTESQKDKLVQGDSTYRDLMNMYDNEFNEYFSK